MSKCGNYFSGANNDNIVVLHRLLKRYHKSLFTVESCTAGVLGSMVTALSGASEIYWGGMITYANAAKIQLGVDRVILQQHGAVSEACARAMAVAGIKYSKADFSIATTGFTEAVVAGEEGSVRNNCVEGDIFIACAYQKSAEKEQVVVKKFNCQGDRLLVRQQFAENTLHFALSSFQRFLHGDA